MPDATYGSRILPLDDDSLRGMRRNALLMNTENTYAGAAAGGAFGSSASTANDTPPPAPPTPAAPTTNQSQGGGTTSPAPPTTDGAPQQQTVSATMPAMTIGQTQPQPGQPSWMSMFGPGQAGYNPSNQPTAQGSGTTKPAPSWMSMFGPGQSGFNPNNGG